MSAFHNLKSVPFRGFLFQFHLYGSSPCIGECVGIHTMGTTGRAIFMRLNFRGVVFNPVVSHGVAPVSVNLGFGVCALVFHVVSP